MRNLGFILGAAAILAACGAPTVDRPDGSVLNNNNNNNNNNNMPPSVPTVTVPPARIPYPIATLRGAVVARRVFVRVSGSNPISETVLPDGTFCIDVPLAADGNYTLSVFAQNEAGLLSTEVDVMVERSAGAPPVPGLLTCGGFEPGDCEGTIEICGDNRDNNCNNLVDEQDPACRTCDDDLFEPNNDFTAAQVVAAQLQNLSICPADIDIYGVYVEKDQRLEVRLSFIHTEGDLELELYTAGGGDSGVPDLLRNSLSQDDDEYLTFTATVTGVYRVRVFGVDDRTVNDYSLAFIVTDN